MFKIFGIKIFPNKFKKNHLWKIVATVKFDKDTLNRLTVFLKANQINFVRVRYKSEIILYIYSKSQEQSALIKRNLDRENAKYTIRKEKVKL